METQEADRLTIKGAPMAQNGQIEVVNMSVNKIKIAKNSRLDIKDESIAGLMQSIKEVGLLQPIGVMRSDHGYEVCYGNRRYLAVTKLGFKKIPVIVHEAQSSHDTDMKNLTENVQRRNISLTEAGRYMELLKQSKMSPAEISVRLGVSKTYVTSCLAAYTQVPKEYQKDLEPKFTNDRKVQPGKIAISTANAIISTAATYRLDKADQGILFEAARSDERFSAANIGKYALAIKNNEKDPIGAAKPLQHINIQVKMEKAEYNDIYAKYVEDGPFSSMSSLVVAILRGEKALKLKIVKTGTHARMGRKNLGDR